MKISDEIRAWCDDTTLWPTRADARAIADRIDREMIERPKDKDGVPIHVGDTVYLESGRKSTVTRIAFSVCGSFFSVFPEHVTHTRPDSWERIADELDEMVDSADSADDSCERLAYLAVRIRKLAEKEGK